MQITQFPTQLVEVGSREPVPNEQGETNNLDAQVTLQLGWGIKTGPDGILELQRYLTSLDPQVAVTVGEAMAEAGRELLAAFPPPPAKPDLRLAATPEQAAEAVRNAEALARART